MNAKKTLFVQYISYSQCVQSPTQESDSLVNPSLIVASTSAKNALTRTRVPADRTERSCHETGRFFCLDMFNVVHFLAANIGGVVDVCNVIPASSAQATQIAWNLPMLSPRTRTPRTIALEWLTTEGPRSCQSKRVSRYQSDVNARTYPYNCNPLVSARTKGIAVLPMVIRGRGRTGLRL
jgi:hypothetical protein